MATEKTCSLADLADKAIGVIGACGFAILLCWNTWEFGRDYGRKEAIAAFECPPGTVYQVVYTDGSIKCVLPRGRA